MFVSLDHQLASLFSVYKNSHHNNFLNPYLKYYINIEIIWQKSPRVTLVMPRECIPRYGPVFSDERIPRILFFKGFHYFHNFHNFSIAV